MDTGTYPDERIATYLADHFVSVRLDISDAAAMRAAGRQFRTAWTPTSVFLDHNQNEVRRSIGYLPASDFLGELMLARAQAALLHGQYDQAATLCRATATDLPDTGAAPEALFWAAISAFRHSGDKADLLRSWSELQQRYPDSTWSKRTSFVKQG